MVEHITITRAKRIQDGVVRLEFTVMEREAPPQEEDAGERRPDHSGTISRLCGEIPAGSHVGPTISYNMGACVIHDDMYDQKFHTALAKRLVKSGHAITYCGMFRSGRLSGSWCTAPRTRPTMP